MFQVRRWGMKTPQKSFVRGYISLWKWQREEKEEEEGTFMSIHGKTENDGVLGWVLGEERGKTYNIFLLTGLTFNFNFLEKERHPSLLCVQKYVQYSYTDKPEEGAFQEGLPSLHNLCWLFWRLVVAFWVLVRSSGRWKDLAQRDSSKQCFNSQSMRGLINFIWIWHTNGSLEK